MFFTLMIICILNLTKVLGIVNHPEKPDPQTWLVDLKTFIEQESPTQEIILIIENRAEFQDSISKTIISALNHLPTYVFSIHHLSEHLPDFYKLPAFKTPRSTTIFIMIVPPKNDILLRIDQLTTLAGKLSRASSQPRCLVIHLSEESSSHENSLRLAWSRKFLDFTLLELSRTNIKNNINSINGIINYNYIKPTLHFFNPFTDFYTTIPFSSGIKLFPNKLQDLNSQFMKVGIINHFPYSKLTRDELGNPVNISGVDYKIVKTISEVMNFKIIIPPQQSEDYGIFHCDSNKTTGLLWNLTHSQIQILGLRLAVTDDCDGKFSAAVKMTEMMRFCAVIPILFIEPKSLLIKWEFFYAGLLVALIFILINVVIRLFHFERNNWSFIQIVSMILGITVSAEPKKVKERIIFGCFIIACAVYSSNIFAEFTHNVLQTKIERNIDTLEELYESELTPVMHPSFAHTLSKENEGLAEKFVEKSWKTTISAEECMQMLVNYKNISCIMRDVAAKLIIENTRDNCGKDRMKIVKERLWTFPITFFLAPDSPYVDRIDDLILKIEETGLIVKWKKDASLNSVNEFHDEQSCNYERQNAFNIFQSLCWVLINGYLTAFIFFIREVVKVKCVK